ncbi:MAG: hypothetical protein JW929_07640 [Anaerolineales bacterium]|nr:hypothetical protein [Anaerolineales bacterium]
MTPTARSLVLGLIGFAAASCSLIHSATAPAPRTLPPPNDFFQGVPIIPGAVSGRAVGTAYLYQIDASLLEVQEFYLREMPLAGWALEDQTGDAAQGDTSIRLRFTKGEELAAIFISEGEGKRTEVSIL